MNYAIVWVTFIGQLEYHIAYRATKAGAISLACRMLGVQVVGVYAVKSTKE